MEGRQRRSFTDDYKRQAVDLVASSGRSVGSVAKELGLRDSVLRRWVEQRGGRLQPSADHAAEIARLQRENERLRMERDILKTVQHRGAPMRRRNSLVLSSAAGRVAAVRLLEAKIPVKKRGPWVHAIAALSNKGAKPVGKLSKPRIKTKQVNTPTFDVRTALYGVVGVDLTEIHGLGPSLALKLVGECGTDLRAWPSAKHFTSWLCLAPGNKISGGKVLSSRTRRSSSRAAALLRLAATTVGRSDTALGAFYRRLSSRAGKSKAVTATARKIAVLFYNTLRHGMSYRDPGADQYEQQYRNRVLANLQRRAKSLGFVLQAIPGDANPAVS
ncbi:transposase-like protein [Bradyrhizobium sp. USDA 4011]